MRLMGHVNNLRIIKPEIAIGIPIICRHHRVTRKSRVRDLQLWRLLKRKMKRTVREVALISFKEALERNGKHEEWVGEERFHGQEEKQLEIQEYGTPAEKHE